MKSKWGPVWCRVRDRVRTSWRPATVLLGPDLADIGVATGDRASLIPDYQPALREWSDWCAAHPGQCVEVGLSAHWLLCCMSRELADQVTSDQGWAEAALAQWERYFGIDAERFEQDWVQRQVRTSAVAMVCAVPRGLLQGVMDAASAHGVRLRWVGPWWIRRARQWLSAASDGSAWHASEPGLVTQLQSREGRLQQGWTEVAGFDAPLESGCADQLCWPSAPPADDLVRVRSGDVILRGPSGGARWDEPIDFVGPRVRPAIWSWALLVLGVAGVMAVADDATQTQQAHADAQAMLSRLQRVQHARQLEREAQARAALPTPAASGASGHAAAGLSGEALRQAAHVSQLLAFPWPRLFQQVESAAASTQAVLTHMSLDLSNWAQAPQSAYEVSLSAAVKDDAAALQWAQSLGEGAQLQSRSALSKPFDTAAGRYVWQAEVTWVGGRAP